MSKASQLRAKLKAAEKRRKRRVESQSQTPKVEAGHAATAAIDVEGLLVQAILYEDERRGNLRDSAVVAALKGVSTGIEPRSDEARQLVERMTLSLSQKNIAKGRPEAAARKLLSLASDSMDPKVPDQFVRYLSLIGI